jgi:hypothetical protein
MRSPGAKESITGVFTSKREGIGSPFVAPKCGTPDPMAPPYCDIQRLSTLSIRFRPERTEISRRLHSQETGPSTKIIDLQGMHLPRFTNKASPETQEPTALRDWLLPMLMNGRVTVRNQGCSTGSKKGRVS